MARTFQTARGLAALAVLAAALPAAAGKERASPRATRTFDHEAHAAVLRARSGGTEGCAGTCHRVEADGSWVQENKKEHTRCFGACHAFATSCGTLAAGAGRVCITCHTNLKARCLPAGAVRPTVGPAWPARYSHRAHIQPRAGSGRQCEGCHGEFGDRAPAGRGAVATGHRDCAGCHAQAAEPRMNQCQSCHTRGGAGPAQPRAANPYAVAGAFSHQKHASERRVGTAGRECLACHANIALAGDDTSIPMPAMRGCMQSCHDGEKAFSAVGTTCTRCHKGSGAGPPAEGAARFSHESHRKRGVDLATCAACHALGADFQVAPPTRGKDHRPCASAGCHVDQFLTRAGSVCTVCHEGSEPWVRQEARYRRRTNSEFGSDFSHRSHVDERRGDNDQCRACHGDRLAGREAPAGHEACAPCHGKRAQPGMDRCGGCHALGASAPRAGKASPWSVAGRFRHETHGRDPRGGQGAQRETRCRECHAKVASAARLTEIALPTMTSCDGCHDGQHAFKTTGFECARCHGNAGGAPRKGAPRP